MISVNLYLTRGHYISDSQILLYIDCVDGTANIEKDMCIEQEFYDNQN